MLRKQLFRTLMRQSIKIDRNPRMKAFIFTTEATFPREGQENVKIERILNAGTADLAMNDLVRGFCAPGEFYKPNKSLTQLVRETFRNPPADLNENQLHQLGFMAVRQLFNCEAIANSLTRPRELPFESTDNVLVSVEPAESSSVPVPVAQIENNSELFSLTEVSTVDAGSILVSHPLRTEDTFSSAVVLVTHACENYASGLVLNRDYKVNFKTRLTKGERVRYGAYLKHFYSMPCFYGGYERMDRHINFCILHRLDSLAHLSTRIDLSNAATDSDVLPSGGDTAGNYMYLSYDFRAVGDEIAAGRVQTSDLKLVEGEITWPEQDLLEALRAHKFFAVRTTAAAHIAMLPPAPLTYEDPQYAVTWAHSDVWYSGQYAWSKVLHLMGGEYRDFAQLQRIISSEKSSLYLRILHTLPGFDLKVTDLSDSDYEDYDSSDEDMDPLEHALEIASDLRDQGFDLDGLTIELGDLLEEPNPYFEDSDDDDE